MPSCTSLNQLPMECTFQFFADGDSRWRLTPNLPSAMSQAYLINTWTFVKETGLYRNGKKTAKVTGTLHRSKAGRSYVS